MRFNKLPYLNVLRNETVYPPFAEIEELVRSHNTDQRSLFLILQPVVEGVLVMLLALAVWKSPTAEHSMRTLAAAEGHGNSVASFVASAVPVSNMTLERRNPAAFQTRMPNANSSVSPAIGSSKEFTPGDRGNTVQPPASNMAATESHHDPVLASSGAEELERDASKQERSEWEGFIAGAWVLPPSGIPSKAYSQPIDAALGLRYALNSQSSLVVELRDNSFISSTIRTTSSFTDTSISIGGQSFRNTIGSASLSSSYSAVMVISLDFGYRYSFIAEGPVTPFAQVLAGGSFSGLLASGSIGIEYGLSAFFIDLGARSDQLFSASSLPRRVLTIEADAGFGW